MACVDGEQPPPDELRLYWMGQKFGSALPEAGGLYDQDYVLIMRMTSLSNIYQTVERYRRAVGEEIHKLTTQERRIIKWLRDERLIDNG